MHMASCTQLYRIDMYQHFLPRTSRVVHRYIVIICNAIIYHNFAILYTILLYQIVSAFSITISLSCTQFNRIKLYLLSLSQFRYLVHNLIVSICNVD